VQTVQTVQMLANPAANLDHAIAQHVELHASDARPFEGVAQRIEQPGGGACSSA
jgi:hypothetical protein